MSLMGMADMASRFGLEEDFQAWDNRYILPVPPDCSYDSHCINGHVKQRREIIALDH